MNKNLSHINEKGDINMVDVSGKTDSLRTASAIGAILMKPETIAKLLKKKTPKGNVLTTAKIAGIIAGKQTSNLIPLCHNIKINKINIDFIIDQDKIIIKSGVISYDKTGAEMEALTAVSIAALTIYDMLKAVDKTIVITGITLDTKSGGKTKILSGKVVSINISSKKGTQKTPVDKCVLIENSGIKNDAHAEKDSDRQVSFLSLNSFDKMKNNKIKLSYGIFGENIDVQGLDVYKLPLKTEIEFISGAKLIVKKIGKECHDHCAIYETVGDCIMPREGIFCKVVRGGVINKNDFFKVIINENRNFDNK